MAGNITFTMIKPSAMEDGFMVPILTKIHEAGFKIRAMKVLTLTMEQAKAFYKIHEARPFYNGLCTFMSSGPIVAAVLEKSNAVEDYRKTIGKTNPAEADAGTIRKLYGRDVEKNAVHGSDSDENAIVESNFFFSQLEWF